MRELDGIVESGGYGRTKMKQLWRLTGLRATTTEANWTFDAGS
jgi:hypothetical protein